MKLRSQFGFRPKCVDIREQMGLGDQHTSKLQMVEQLGGKVRDAWPDMPEGITDRNADVWEALFSLADAGGEWPTRARVAAVALLRRGEWSLGIRLLTDIRTVFGDREAMRTKDLLNVSNQYGGVGLGGHQGKTINDRSLAVRLRGHEISSKDVRVGEWHGKGYAK